MDNTKKIENECNRLVIKPFTEAEREEVKSARKRTGIDRPLFYHDAIVEYARKINGDNNA